jgi:predicted transglutaminase-like cysteine proteinase
MVWGARRSAAAGLFFIASVTAQVQAAAGGVPSVMPTAGWASPPIGAVQFCRDFPDDCERVGGLAPMEMSLETWRSLVAVNQHVNEAIQPMTDLELYGVEEHWTIPSEYGDCEDYALLKRRMLIERGWPSGALLIAVAFDEVGDGHAVLIARTDNGDLVLDNKVDEIRLWHETPYLYVKRQSAADPRRWISVSDPRLHVGGATAGH